jgi:hypothetical protein
MHPVGRSRQHALGAPMTDYDLIHVAVAPPANLNADLVSGVAAAISKSPYQTRLLLAGEVPKIVAHCDSVQAAESVVRSLRGLGLAAIACEHNELRQLPQTFQAQALEFKEAEVLFRDSAGREKKLAESNVFLVLVGRIESYLEMETTKQKMKFSLGRTLLMGGIPVWRAVDEETKTHSTQAESFVRLYEVQSNEPGVDIFQKHMSYSFLGANVAASSLANFVALVRGLRQAFPEAIFDDRLAKPSVLTTSSRRDWEDVEMTCKLIYLFHAAAAGLYQRP